MDNKKKMTEKITVNLNVVELGYIDLLVSEGFYSNRTDFIKDSIRKNLDTLSVETSNLLEKKRILYEVNIGVERLTLYEIEKIINEGCQKKIIHIGLLRIDEDIPLELMKKAIKTIKIFGVNICTEEVKKFYEL